MYIFIVADVEDEEKHIFEINVKRTSDGNMSMCVAKSSFGDCEKIVVDFGDGTTEILTGDISSANHTYAETIDNATIKIEGDFKLIEASWNGGLATNNYSIVFDELVLPSGLEKIGDYAFYSLPSCQRIAIPNSVTSIGNYAFKECQETVINIPSEVVTIGQSAFQQTGVINITIPNSVTSVGNYAFYECTKLKKATINQSCTISNSQFYNCTSLSEVTISNNVTGIDNYAFYGCSSLTEITISSSVNSIGYGAFDGRYINQINCDFTRQELVQKCDPAYVIRDMQSGTTYTFHCTDGDITLQGQA